MSTTSMPSQHQLRAELEAMVLGDLLGSAGGEGEELVVYRQDYGERSLWVRPLAMFLETVEAEGQRVPRFKFVGDT